MAHGKTALVLGATGGIGGEVARQLRAAGWQVRALNRNAAKMEQREMAEMRYLWQQPVRMDNKRLVGWLGSEPHTPLDDAVKATLEGLGAFEPMRPAAAARA
jgi:nucleoside-diphosphate-sugar epimerase